MLRQNTNALGIIFPNRYDNPVPELVTERAMASIPFAGRYRMVDFVLSSMANCGISNVSIVVRKNYHSLMDHLGTGREWDMARRHGGLNIVPPFAEKGVRIYSGRVEALGSILNFLENQKEKYVVMSDANIAVNYDFNALLAAHQASGADVTVAYQKTEIPEGAAFPVHSFQACGYLKSQDSAFLFPQLPVLLLHLPQLLQSHVLYSAE